MTDTPLHAPGTFCWVDLATTDPGRAKGFYTAVFGWAADDLPTDLGPPYTIFSQDTKGVCGLYPLGPGQGDHPYWLSYVCVADLDATVVTAQSLGGQVPIAPMDIMEEGRLAVIQDPTGAHLGLWQPRRHPGAAPCNAPGAPSWNELQTNDLDAAAAFYRGLFGWTLKSSQTFMAGAYKLFVRDGREVGGMLAIGEDRGPVPPNWSVYFGVRDCDATVAQCEWLGGKVLAPAMEVSGVGRFAFLADPQGAVFAVIAHARAQI
jgi:predicted enzyme related to lactoylglutathione lyase